ncbi:hypothetical protein DFH06DRAFT_1233093 [Mycena polygramma]|nr:hypothetical protein DFH06DRAFT_1233093 [Mycena polygramma]
MDRTFLDDSDDDFDSDISSDDSDFDPDVPEPEMELDEDLAGPAIQLQQTQKLRAEMQGNVRDKVKAVLYAMENEKINLPIFLDALSWGDHDCIIDPKIRSARSALMHSTELPGIVRRWWKPPLSTGSHHARAKGGREVLENLAEEITRSAIERELDSLTEILCSPAGNDVDEEELTGSSFDGLIHDVKELAPHVWALVRRMAFSSKQEERNTHKNPERLVLAVISILSYSRSHHRNRLQKLFAVYFKFRGLSAKGFDTLHALGLTMSNKWTGLAVGRMSKRAMDTVVKLMDLYPWLLSYDNTQISFRVFSQRLDNQGKFGNGTACTVYIKRRATPLSPTANRDLQVKRAAGLENPISLLEIFDLAQAAAPRLIVQTNYHILRVLLDAHKFDFDSYSGKDSNILARPGRINGLPFGPDDITLQYLLGTVGIPEASYEDNERLIDEWLRQLKMDAPEVQQKIGTERLQAWVGDQLTVDRLRNIFQFRSEDSNSFDRLDWMLIPPGWLHIMMCFANSLHKQHLGTSKGRGLSQAFDVLQRKGLGVTHIQGPFYHNINEALHHVADAQIREAWLEVSGTRNLAELRAKTPEQLIVLADTLRREHASTEALNRMNAVHRPKDTHDDIKYQSIMFCRDVLQYIILKSGIKHGDVGLMEDMLPDLLFRFAGGKNSNYTGEVLEMLQGLNKEWPDEVRNFIRYHCWAINQTVKPDGFLPVDEAQEHNIKDIKVTHRSQGPKVDWEYLKKLHPSIHVIRAVSMFMESEFNTASRGKKHTVPKKELDIQSLQKWYRDSRVHKFTPRRRIGIQKDQPKDYIALGQTALLTKNRMDRWKESRYFPRSTTEDWADFSDDSEDEAS